MSPSALDGDAEQMLGLFMNTLPVLADLSADRRHPRLRGLPGASMMVRRTAIDELGGLDERYFLYYEELDFCLKLTRAGWECWYVPDSRVTHISGQSSGVTDRSRRAARLG